MKHKGGKLVLRCLIDQEGDLYVAHCIDLSLGVQGDSEADVKERMEAAIGSHLQRVTEIYREGDTASAMQLLNRKAPLSIRVKYHLAKLLRHFHSLRPPASPIWEESRPYPIICA
ncbi:MAG: hypothetical protein ACLFMW_10875 [Ectothiorhodospira sp.]